jgi:hypothetical protein
VVHAVASALGWVVALAITFAFVGFLVWMLRGLVRESKGKPRLRVLWFLAFVIGLFLLWAASRVVP